MSPAEERFIALMGGRVVRVRWVHDRQTGFTLALYWHLGGRLKREGFRREVRYGQYYVDFANDLNRIIEIDGDAYHQDVVADMDREIYIREWCRRADRTREARFLRIPAYRLHNERPRVQKEVLEFIY